MIYNDGNTCESCEHFKKQIDKGHKHIGECRFAPFGASQGGYAFFSVIHESDEGCAQHTKRKTPFA